MNKDKTWIYEITNEGGKDTSFLLKLNGKIIKSYPKKSFTFDEFTTDAVSKIYDAYALTTKEAAIKIQFSTKKIIFSFLRE